MINKTFELSPDYRGATITAYIVDNTPEPSSRRAAPSSSAPAEATVFSQTARLNRS